MIVATGPASTAGSAWVDVLRGAGVPVLGESLPAEWSEGVRADVHPSYFSTLTEQGVYYKTNPDPFSQAYLDAASSAPFAIGMKVVAVLRTERAYLDHVVASMPHFRTRTAGAGDLESVLMWWNDNFLLLRDAATRRYPLRLVTDEALARDPEGATRSTLAFLGVEPTEAAIAQARRCPPPVAVESAVDLEMPVTVLDVFEALHRRVDNEEGFDRTFIEHLYAVNEALTPHVLRLQVATLREQAIRRKRNAEGSR
jgi:hypothetical protein